MAVQRVSRKSFWFSFSTSLPFSFPIYRCFLLPLYSPFRVLSRTCLYLFFYIADGSTGRLRWHSGINVDGLIWSHWHLYCWLGLPFNGLISFATEPCRHPYVMCMVDSIWYIMFDTLCVLQLISVLYILHLYLTVFNYYSRVKCARKPTRSLWQSHLVEGVAQSVGLYCTPSRYLLSLLVIINQ